MAPARLVVAIDGPAGAGKSTIARHLAQRCSLLYIDSGAMYRCVALEARRQGIQPGDVTALGRCARSLQIQFLSQHGEQRILLNGEDVTQAIRENEISTLASIVSAAPPVREAMVALQRQMAKEGRIVMEGRDIGTVVFPDAEVKVFLTASLKERARRRTGDLAAALPGGETVDPSKVEEELEFRDRRDREREVAPLVAAPDAILIVTDELEIAQVVDRIAALLPGEPVSHSEHSSR